MAISLFLRSKFIFLLFFFLIVSFQTVFRCEFLYSFFRSMWYNYINYIYFSRLNYRFLALQSSSSALNLKLSFFSKTEVIIIIVHACYVSSIVSDSLRPYGLQPARLLCPWDSPGKNAEEGCHALLQVSHHYLPCFIEEYNRYRADLPFIFSVHYDYQYSAFSAIFNTHCFISILILTKPNFREVRLTSLRSPSCPHLVSVMN